MGELIDVVIEVPKGSRNKYEFDHERGVFILDRRLFSAMTYPADYGYVLDTLGEDGDPLDAMVLVDEPTFPGCWIRARPLGVFFMEDEAGPDAKVIGLVEGDPLWDGVKELDNLPGSVLAEIHHFFDVYKDLEPDKTSSTVGYEGVERAHKEIEAARRRAGN